MLRPTALAAVLLVPAAVAAQPAPSATAAPPPPTAYSPMPPPPPGPPPVLQPGPGMPGAPPPGAPLQTAPPPFAPPPQGLMPPSYAAPAYAGKPQLVPYNGGPIPYGATIVTKPSSNLVNAGIGISVGSYGIAALFAFFGCLPGKDSSCGSTLWLYVPLVGPFVVAGHPDSTSGGRPPAILDGLGQAAGLALLIAGYAAPNQFIELPRARFAGIPTRVEIVPASVGTIGGASVRVTGF